MSTFFMPDNFFYFVIGFSISMVMAVYLSFAYHKTRLLYCNILMFVVVAARFCSEYLIHDVKSLEDASLVASFHSTAMLFIGFLLWISVFLYIRPFRRFENESTINNYYIIFVLVLPTLPSVYALMTRQVFVFHPEQINGYWLFTSKGTLWSDYHFWQAYVFNTLITNLLLILHIIRSKKNRILQVVILGSSIIFPYFLASVNSFAGFEALNLPNVAYPFLLHVMVMTWFVSDYRIFKDAFQGPMIDTLNSIADLVVVTNLSGTINFNNARFTAAFSDRTGIDFVEFIKGHSALERNGIKDMLSDDSRKHSIMLKNRHDEERIFDLSSTDLKRHERQTGNIYVLSDITDKVQNQKRLEESNAIKDTLFGIIGHDLRKPALSFRHIMSKINRLVQSDRLDKLKSLSHVLEDSASSLIKLLDNLLYWSQLQKNKVSIHKTTFEVKSIVKELIEIHRSRASLDQITVIDETSDQHQIHSDRNICLTVFGNILDNALKYTPKTGEIRIKSKLNATGIVITISDTGIGMDAKNAAPVSSDKYLSFGMGLELVRNLLVHIDGDMSITSELNKGTCVSVTLPNQVTQITTDDRARLSSSYSLN